MQSKRTVIINMLADLGTKYWILQGPILLLVGCDFLIRKSVAYIRRQNEATNLFVRTAAAAVSFCMAVSLMPMSVRAADESSQSAAEHLAELINKIEALPDAESICDNGYTADDFNDLSDTVNTITAEVDALSEEARLQINETYINKLNSLAGVSIDLCNLNAGLVNHEITFALTNIEAENLSENNNLSVMLTALEGYELPDPAEIVVKSKTEIYSTKNYSLITLDDGRIRIEMADMKEDITIMAEGVESMNLTSLFSLPQGITSETELQQAIDNHTEGPILISNVVLSQTITIFGNKAITLIGGSLSRAPGFIGDMIKIVNDSTLVLEDIIIDGASESEDTFGYLINAEGHLTMNTGTELKNNKNTAVYVKGSTFTMNGGVIKYNQAKNGGAINIGSAKSKFIMNDGELSYNSAQTKGGAIYNNTYIFTLTNPIIEIKGGKIEYNSVTGTDDKAYGGAIYNYNYLKITGGSIQYNSVENGLGGGIYVGMGKFVFAGGLIANNTAMEHKGDNIGIPNSEFILQGTAKTENGNVFLQGKINVSESIQNPIVIGIKDNPYAGTVVAEGTEVYQLTQDDLLKFSYYDGRYNFAFKLIDNQIVLADKLDVVYLNGETGNDSLGGDSAENAVKTFERAKSLMRDDGRIRINGTVIVNDKQEWFLDEKSWGIYREANFKDALIKITSNGELTLHDIEINGNDIKANAPIVDVYGGKLILQEGAALKYNNNTADYGGGVTVKNDGSAIGFMDMKGGSVEYNSSMQGGAGIYVEGKLSVENGTIQYNNQSYNGNNSLGGGVLINSDSDVLSIKGGIIKNNRSSFGGGIYVMKGELTLDGVKIESNSSKTSGGSGVYFTNDSVLKLGEVNMPKNNNYISMGDTAKIFITKQPTNQIQIDIDDFDLTNSQESRELVKADASYGNDLNIDDYYVLCDNHKYEAKLSEDSKSVNLVKKSAGISIEIHYESDVLNKDTVYNLRSLWSGEFNDPTIEWTLEDKTSDSTKLTVDEEDSMFATLIIGLDETAEFLKINAKIQGTNLSDSYIVTVSGNERNEVEVINSSAANSGAGRYKPNASVTLNAGSRYGHSFDHWSCDDASVVIADIHSATTTFTMPKKDITITAHWKSTGSNSNHKYEGIVDKKNDSYYYIKGKPTGKGFVLLDKQENLLNKVEIDEFVKNQYTSETVYFVKEDKTIAKHEWIIIDKNGQVVDVLPVGQFNQQYDSNFKVYLADEKGLLVRSWTDVEGNRYLFNEDYTAKYKYWHQDQNEWYLFDNYTLVKNRWIASTKGRWYYMGSDGKMVVNQWVDGYWINEEGIYWSQYYSG